MFEIIQIKLFGRQPAAKVTDKNLDRIIRRDFGSNALEVKQRLQGVTSNTHNGKNRISAAILKLSNKDLNSIEHYIGISNHDFRDIISLAEYPRSSKFSLDATQGENLKRIYLDDWTEYSEWLNK
jgi:hypothetical protein